MRKQVINPQDIIDKSIEICFNCGFDSFTTAKAAKEIKISEGSIFRYFKSRLALLEQCFLHVNKMINENLLEFYAANSNKKFVRFKLLWRNFYLYLCNHPQYTSFYIHYRLCFKLSNDLKKFKQPFYDKFAEILSLSSYTEKTETGTFFLFIEQNTMAFAMEHSKGLLGCDEITIHKLYTILIYGLNSLMQKPLEVIE